MKVIRSLLPEARENAGDQVAIGEGSDTSLLDQSQSDVGKTWAILITFDTCLNISQNNEINLNAKPLN